MNFNLKILRVNGISYTPSRQRIEPSYFMILSRQSYGMENKTRLLKDYMPVEKQDVHQSMGLTDSVLILCLI